MLIFINFMHDFNWVNRYSLIFINYLINLFRIINATINLNAFNAIYIYDFMMLNFINFIIFFVDLRLSIFRFIIFIF
jgi:hypothetical protein